jgi:hypothetical protein
MPYKDNRKECPVCGEVFEGENNACDRCSCLAQYGVIFVGVDNQKSNEENRPCRTGHFCVISDYSPEFAHATEDFHPQLKQNVLRNRFCFIDYEFGKKLKIFDNPLLIN